VVLDAWSEEHAKDAGAYTAMVSGTALAAVAPLLGRSEANAALAARLLRLALGTARGLEQAELPAPGEEDDEDDDEDDDEEDDEDDLFDDDFGGIGGEYDDDVDAGGMSPFAPAEDYMMLSDMLAAQGEDASAGGLGQWGAAEVLGVDEDRLAYPQPRRDPLLRVPLAARIRAVVVGLLDAEGNAPAWLGRLPPGDAAALRQLVAGG